MPGCGAPTGARRPAVQLGDIVRLVERKFGHPHAAQARRTKGARARSHPRRARLRVACRCRQPREARGAGPAYRPAGLLTLGPRLDRKRSSFACAYRRYPGPLSRSFGGGARAYTGTAGGVRAAGGCHVGHLPPRIRYSPACARLEDGADIAATRYSQSRPQERADTGTPGPRGAHLTQRYLGVREVPPPRSALLR